MSEEHVNPVATSGERDKNEADSFNVTALRAERDAAVAAVERVRAIHEQHPRWPDKCGGCDGYYPCATVAALDGAPEPGLSESERLEIEGTPYVWSPDSLAYQLDGWVNDLGIPGNSVLKEFGLQDGVYYEDQSVLSQKLQEVTIAWLEEHGYRRDGAPEPEPEWEYGYTDHGMNPMRGCQDFATAKACAQGMQESVVRRIKAGPWLPVEGENDAAVHQNTGL